MNTFRIYNFDLAKAENSKKAKMIRTYLDVEGTNEQSELYQSRLIFLRKEVFKETKAVS